MSSEKNAENRRTSQLNCTAPVSRIYILKIANERSWSCSPMYNWYLRPSEMPSGSYGSSKTVTLKAKILLTNFRMETVWSPYFTLNYYSISFHGIICYGKTSEQNKSSTVLKMLLRYFLFQSSSSKLRMFREKNAENRRTSKLNCTAPVSRIFILKIANERSWSCRPMYN